MTLLWMLAGVVGGLGLATLLAALAWRWVANAIDAGGFV